MTISGEHQVDNVAPACDASRHGGAHTLASDVNVSIIGEPTAFSHQGCRVLVHDCQVVAGTVVTPLNVERRKLQ